MVKKYITASVSENVYRYKYDYIGTSFPNSPYL